MKKLESFQHSKFDLSHKDKSKVKGGDTSKSYRDTDTNTCGVITCDKVLSDTCCSLKDPMCGIIN